ncbi:MAG: DUF1232 domain-containing protein [Candidatus Cloacimonetes bacterium]|nr:DUF1232 domain-containing protein [Candidatus Cloacimonadota bacterium]
MLEVDEKTNIERVEKVKRKINEDFVKKGAEKISTEDIERIISKSDKIIAVVRKIPVLGRYIEDVIVMTQLLTDYINGSYRNVPWWVIASVTFALVYLISPVDLIPDVIPVIGYVDDAFVIGVCLHLIENDLQIYQEWRISNGS